MKKCSKVLCLMLVVFMMTGCMKIQTNMTINKDKSMDFSLIYAVENSLLEQNGSESLLEEDLVKKAEEQGFKAEEYSDGSMTGFKLSKNFDNIDDVSSEKEVNYTLESTVNDSKQNDIFTVKKGFFKNTYTLKMENETSDEVENGINNIGDSNAINELGNQTNDTNTLTDTNTTQDTVVPSKINNITIDEPDTNDQDDFSSDMALSMLSSMDMTFTLNLPYKAISSNATSIENDGKNLKWNLLDTNLQNITVQFELYNMNNIYLTIGIAIILIIIILIIIKKRKPKAPVGTPILVEDTPLHNMTQTPQAVAPITNMTPDSSVQINNTNPNIVNQTPQINQDSETPIDTLNIDNPSNTPVSATVPGPTPQVIPTPSVEPIKPVVPTINDPKIETLDTLQTPKTETNQPSPLESKIDIN